MNEVTNLTNYFSSAVVITWVYTPINYKIKIAVVNIFCKTNKINATAHCGIYIVVAMACGFLPNGDF